LTAAKRKTFSPFHS